MISTHINFNELSVGIFNGRIVAFNPDILDELSCKGRSISQFPGRHRGWLYQSSSSCPLHLFKYQHSELIFQIGSRIPAPRTTMWYSRLEGMSGSQFKSLDMVVRWSGRCSGGDVARAMNWTADKPGLRVVSRHAAGTAAPQRTGGPVDKGVQQQLL